MKAEGRVRVAIEEMTRRLVAEYKPEKIILCEIHRSLQARDQFIAEILEKGEVLYAA